MTEKEAIARIKDHMIVHALNEERAVYITQALNMAIKALEEIQQYREIGTVEKCQEAIEKQKAKKPECYVYREVGKILCPNCGEVFWDLEECGLNVCPWCGQAIEFLEE